VSARPVAAQPAIREAKKGATPDTGPEGGTLRRAAPVAKAPARPSVAKAESEADHDEANAATKKPADLAKELNGRGRRLDGAQTARSGWADGHEAGKDRSPKTLIDSPAPRGGQAAPGMARDAEAGDEKSQATSRPATAPAGGKGKAVLALVRDEDKRGARQESPERLKAEQARGMLEEQKRQYERSLGSLAEARSGKAPGRGAGAGKPLVITLNFLPLAGRATVTGSDLAAKKALAGPTTRPAADVSAQDAARAREAPPKDTIKK